MSDNILPWMRIIDALVETPILEDSMMWIHDSKGLMKASLYSYLNINKNAVLANNFYDKHSSSYQLREYLIINSNIKTIFIDAYMTNIDEFDLNTTVHINIDHLSYFMKNLNICFYLIPYIMKIFIDLFIR